MGHLYTYREIYMSPHFRIPQAEELQYYVDFHIPLTC